MTVPTLPADAREWILADDHREAVDLYAAGRFWDAHEAWERLWRVTPPGSERELLQGLIQAAGALLKAEQGNAAGLASLSRRALGHLAAAGGDEPLLGVDVPRFSRELERFAASPDSAPRPRLSLIVRSRDRLGSLTDGAVRQGAGQEWAGTGYLVRANPARPDFYSGQFLVLDQPPDPASIEDWMATFRRELAAVDPHFIRIGWETDDDAAWPGRSVLPAGTDYQHLAVLRRDDVPAPVDLAGLSIRALHRDTDWDQMVQLSIAETAPHYVDAYAAYYRWHVGIYRDLVAPPRGGAFWGAFDGDRLAGCLGLVTTPRWMRFVDVMTGASHRRRGVCSALIAHALGVGFADHPGAIAIIVSNAGSDADRLYRRLGFRQIGSQHELSRPAR